MTKETGQGGPARAPLNGHSNPNDLVTLTPIGDVLVALRELDQADLAHVMRLMAPRRGNRRRWTVADVERVAARLAAKRMAS